jgi:hypothetical protein
MKAKSGERGQDSWGQECWDRTAGDKSVGTGQLGTRVLGQDSWGQECWDRTARTGESFRSACAGPTGSLAGTASSFSTPDMPTKDY